MASVLSRWSRGWGEPVEGGGPEDTPSTTCLRTAGTGTGQQWFGNGEEPGEGGGSSRALGG